MPSIAESDKAEMEEFLQNIRMLVNTLGHKVFDEKRELKSKKNQRRNPNCIIIFDAKDNISYVVASLIINNTGASYYVQKHK